MKYKYRPTSKGELREIVKKEVEKQGKNADLNMIDTSLVTDMSEIFWGIEFNGNISKWDVSNVETMRNMFTDTEFNGDISKWDVSNVKDMCCMFQGSKFNGDISKWDVSNVTDMAIMFQESEFNGNISQWNVSNVKDMWRMFYGSKFNGDISGWDVSNVEQTYMMLCDSKIPYKVKATLILKLSKNADCDLEKIIEGFEKRNNAVEFVLNNFNQEDICYAFRKANVPYKKVMHLISKLLKFDCLYNIYPALYGKMIDDMLDI